MLYLPPVRTLLSHGYTLNVYSIATSYAAASTKQNDAIHTVGYRVSVRPIVQSAGSPYCRMNVNPHANPPEVDALGCEDTKLSHYYIMHTRNTKRSIS